MSESEVTTTEVQEVAETSAESAPETPQADTSLEGSEKVEVKGEAPQGETPKEAKPAFTPDYKMKAYDKEWELKDPFLKGLIKDEESQKKVKEIAQKYEAFDTFKEHYDKLREVHQTFKTETTPKAQVYDAATHYLAKKDYQSFFDMLQVPTEDIFRYAIQKAEESQLPPEQRQHIEMQRQVQKEREMLAHQNQQLLSQQQTQAVQYRNQELNWVMSRPEISQVVQSFDSKQGPGAFRNLVVEKGLAHFAATGTDIPTEQAVQEVVKLIGGFVTPTNLNGTPAAPQGSQLIHQNEAPPIIPNVTGKGTSPVKKQIRSLADLKKMAGERRP